MEKTIISEQMGIHNEWYEQARKMTLDKLPEFLNHLMNDYAHDYGTICHAVAAGSIAAAWAMNAGDQGGITGFQAGCVMWEWVKNWSYRNNKCGLKMVNFDDMLYPQYERKFDKYISRDHWNSLQKEAARLLSECELSYQKYLVDIEQYEINFAKFKEKYPDYDNRPEFYEHLGCGTGEQWSEYYAKKERGFEFAPQKPYDPRPHRDVYEHWKSIVAARVPFGYRISDD